jgi:hypothetical protein
MASARSRGHGADSVPMGCTCLCSQPGMPTDLWVAIETMAESRAESGPAEDVVANRRRPDDLRTRCSLGPNRSRPNDLMEF